SADAALKLARHLLALGFVYSNSGYLPVRLSENEFRHCLDILKSDRDRTLFESFYDRQDNGIYKQKDTVGWKKYSRIIEPLANAGYRDEASRKPFIVEAESLLDELLRRDSRNAAAWGLYLNNYWRFSFGAVGDRPLGANVLNKNQADKIKLAAKKCPHDEWIQRWQKRLRGEGSIQADPDMRRPGQMWRELEFPALDYGYY
ncbi:MAG: hypothetical protein LBI02_08885, partial [Opitutaceae bacterium]|nr:hypothetical protein [Opitutaceae bacterium]